MAFLSRNLILDLLLTALAPAIWGTTYIVTSRFLPPDRPFIAALLRVLPAGIALLIAAMSADGISRIHNIEQIDRGYQNIEGRLNALGARITRI